MNADIDGTFSHNQEWKWFIDLIQDRYELDDVKSWAEFQERNSSIPGGDGERGDQ